MLIDPISQKPSPWRPGRVRRVRAGSEGGTHVDDESAEVARAIMASMTAQQLAEAVNSGLIAPDRLPTTPIDYVV